MAMKSQNTDAAPMMDINTTPLIDVMLVLLIMFILTIPMQNHAVKLDTPSARTPSKMPLPDKNEVAVTNADRVRRAAGAGQCNAVLIKPNQAGTVTETRAAFDAARDAGMGAIVSARSGETEDVTIVHLAVGWNAAQLKVGSFSRSERMAKWNEALRIEEAIGVRK